MCSPIEAGAAALSLVSGKMAARMGRGKLVRVRSSVLTTGWDYADDEPVHVAEYAAQQAYAAAEVGPSEIDVIELHDAAAPAEIIYYEYLGLADPGEGVALLECGATPSPGSARPRDS